jgi:predicted secreted protein with PEFG-CTERM motif
MNTLAISSFFVLFVLVMTLAVTPDAYAQSTASISAPAGTSSPGCETTDECFIPASVTVDVGGIVTWSNDDTAAHTVTSGTAGDGPDGNFDSSLFMAGTTFSWTATEAGEYPYFCMVHPWMKGIVVVAEAAMDEEPMMEEEAMMSGVNLGLDIDPMPPFDQTSNDMITLSFTAKSDELKGSSMTPGTIDHLDYKVVISKDGNEIWSDQFHDHDGNLELQITPSDGSFSTTGGQNDAGNTSTGAYMVTGPVLMDNGNYEISGQIVGIEFNPLSTPLVDDFALQVVPEFGPIVMIALAVAIVGTIVITTKSQIIQKL